MFYFPNEFFDKDKVTKKFIYEYIDNMKIYIRRNYPKLSDEKIESKLRTLITKRIKSPTAYFTRKLEGADTELSQMPLLEFTDLIKDDIITPSGSVFCKSTEEKSFFTDYIQIKKDERKKTKKDMMHYAEIDEGYKSLLKHYDQLSIKIGINAISGTMCSSIFFKSLNCYNSITSSVRHNIMLGYASIEKLLESNIYLKDENDGIGFIVNILKLYPGDEILSNVIEKYKLKIPSIKDIEEYIIPCIYISFKSDGDLKDLHYLIDGLSDLERAFVFYTQNFKNLFYTNSDIFRKFFDYLFDIKYDINEIMKDPKYNNDTSLYALEDGALFTLTLMIRADEIANLTIDEIDKNNKEVKCILQYTYFQLASTLSRLNDLFNTFIFVPLNLHKPFEHTNMIRKCVILSDTDSIIFTTIKWIAWYTKKITIDQKSLNFNSLIVYLSSKFLDYIFCIFSRDANIETDNIKVINMKNEFFYSLLLRTGISKHYGGLIKMQEGIILSKPKFDFKGKNFKGSDLTTDTLKVIEDFTKYILYSVEKDPNLNFSHIINKVIAHEATVYNNLKQGKTNYLPQKPIKDKSEYKYPYSSNWFYYHLWQSVFADDYEDIIIPQKCKSVSLKYKINLNNLNKLAYMTDINRSIYEKFERFLLENNNKNITQIIIPPSINIPKELLPLIDYKKIIYNQNYGLYLILRSFGIGPIEIKSDKFLISEIYANKTFK